MSASNESSRRPHVRQQSEPGGLPFQPFLSEERQARSKTCSEQKHLHVLMQRQ